MTAPTRLAENIYLIDGMDLGMPERTGTYVLIEDHITLIETSASPSAPYILEGLEQLGITPDQIKYIIVTHIHLDHSGGAGLMLTHCKHAQLAVHPKGARHLVDPSRLIASAKMVYGERFDTLFDPILPVPEERLLTMADGETLEIGKECTLTFYDTPGHSNHHFSIYHPGVNGIFTGDTAGIVYPELSRRGLNLFLPSTSPNQFDPEKMLNSLRLYEKLGAERLFLGHYGMVECPAEVYKQIDSWLTTFLQIANESILEVNGVAEQSALISQRLYHEVKSHLLSLGVAADEPVMDLVRLDLDVSAMGLVDYLIKQK